MTTKEAKELFNRLYATPAMVIGVIIVAAGLVIFLMGISNLDSYFGKDIAPLQLGAGASLALTGLVVFTLGSIHGEIRRNSEILLTIHTPGWRQPEVEMQQIPKSVPPAMLPCPECGTELNVHATVCPKCKKEFK